MALSQSLPEAGATPNICAWCERAIRSRRQLNRGALSICRGCSDRLVREAARSAEARRSLAQGSAANG
jgi:hypothetical protein